ncbi:hypothetical protein CRV24_003305 [Beauveria bassiana]|nr:hypothetical protein CRV24_003305 [Beauveria bassiana]
MDPSYRAPWLKAPPRNSQPAPLQSRWLYSELSTPRRATYSVLASRFQTESAPTRVAKPPGAVLTQLASQPAHLVAINQRQFSIFICHLRICYGCLKFSNGTRLSCKLRSYCLTDSPRNVPAMCACDLSSMRAVCGPLPCADCVL